MPDDTLTFEPVLTVTLERAQDGDHEHHRAIIRQDGQDDVTLPAPTAREALTLAANSVE